MPNVQIHRHREPSLRRAVIELAEASARVDGFRFLSDHLWLDLHDDAPGFHAASIERDDTLIAYAQAASANSGVIVESTVAPVHRDDTSLEPAVLGALLDDLKRTADPDVAGGDEIPVTWWVHDVTPGHDVIAAEQSFTPTRELLQMRLPLPTGMEVGVETRAFVVGQDEEAWLAVNNRAFADHGEQGGWDLATLRQRELESWFDPEGFRLHERDGRLAAFCWTKLHPGSAAPGGDDAPADHDAPPPEPPLGEIYVIGADPDFQGLGLGRALTLAGLESIYQRGVSTGMLYVDGDNTAAVGLYDALGFSVTRTDRAYTTTLRRVPST